MPVSPDVLLRDDTLVLRYRLEDLFIASRVLRLSVCQLVFEFLRYLDFVC